MIRVLFICLGNICRSPLAETIFNHKIKEKELDHLIQSDSCGTSNYHIGKFPDERTLQCAKNRGILINHRGRQIKPLDLEEFDYLIAMDKSNLSNIKKLMQQTGLSHDHLYLMREFQPNSPHIDVPDPYYGEINGFEEVYDILEESIDNFLAKILLENQLCRK